MPRSLHDAIVAEANHLQLLNTPNPLVQNLEKWASNIAHDYLYHNVDLNQGIAKIAREQGLNDHQIERLIQRVNVDVFQTKYALSKGSNVRRVEFPIAQLDQVRQLLGKAPTQSGEIEVLYNKGAQSMDKKAWLELEASAGDHLNFFHGAEESPALYDEDEVADRYRALVLKKALGAYNEFCKQAQESKQLLIGRIMHLGDALIEYALHGHNPQSMFEKVAREANLGVREQGLLCKYAEEKLAKLQQEKRAPSTFTLALHPIEADSVHASVLNKFALYHPDDLPAIVVNGKTVRGYNDMIKMASLVKEAFEEAVKIATSGAEGAVKKVKEVLERKRSKTQPDSDAEPKEMDLEEENDNYGNAIY